MRVGKMYFIFPPGINFSFSLFNSLKLNYLNE